MMISIIPEYIDGVGDCCRVKRTEGELMHEKKVNFVLRELFKNNLVDYTAVRQKSIRLLKQKSLIPIYINASEILIPIKVRESLFKKDGCYGYVNVFEIRKIFEGELLLVSGERIPYLDTKRAVQKREFMAECLSKQFSTLLANQSSGIRGQASDQVIGDYLLFLLRKAMEKQKHEKLN